MTFHTLIWDQYVPHWLQYGGYSSSEVETIMQEFISGVLNRYGSAVYSWDIVNEAIGDLSYHDPQPYRTNFFIMYISLRVLFNLYFCLRY